MQVKYHNNKQVNMKVLPWLPSLHCSHIFHMKLHNPENKKKQIKFQR